MDQLTIYDIKQEKKPRLCPNCIYWQLLPEHEQPPEGWGERGYCSKHSQNTSYYNRGCSFYQEWTKEPDWRLNVKKLPFYKLHRYITVLECMYSADMFKHRVIKSNMDKNWRKYWTKNGIECKQEDL